MNTQPQNNEAVKTRKPHDPEKRKPQVPSKRANAIKVPNTTGNQKMEFAERLRFFRQQENLTLKKLAEELNMSESNLSRVEKGHVSIDIDIMIYLYKKYQINLKWFFFGEGRRKETDPEKNLITDIATIYQVQRALKEQQHSIQLQLFRYAEENRKLQNEINELKIKLQSIGTQ